MKKFLFVLIVVFSFGVVVAKADNDRIITKDKLPVAAQTFVKEHFGGLKISYVKEERDFLEKNYQVVFTDGSKLEFTRAGEWKEVDCRYTVVPAAIVPAKISDYIKENYAGEKILQIDRDRYDYEVKLSNRLELTFDKKFNIIDIDD